MHRNGILAENIARLDQQQNELRARFDDLQGKPTHSDDLYELGSIQARYDNVFKGLEMPGAPGPLTGESPRTYRARLFTELKPLSQKWKDFDPYNRHLSENVIGAAEEGILADVRRVVANPAQGSFRNPGRLRAVTTVGDGGHRVVEYFGDPGEWMKDFAGEYGVGRLNPAAVAAGRYGRR